ncbi:hypothetical protein [Vibrio sp. 10N.286.49.B3]|uniref:hypothetical protein n=1 Tax=Vibrio sp. 10N.286.49.B3 TaxID=1880855 RepID=UPI0032206387
MNPSYRLQIIKEVALKNQKTATEQDPMADYISRLLEARENGEQVVEQKQHFGGCHFNEDIGGWVSNFWDNK